MLPPSDSRVLARSTHAAGTVAATIDALWWHDGAWHSLQWWQIEQALWTSAEERLTVVPAAAPDQVLLLTVDPESRLPEVVRERVMASILASVVLEVGAGVQVSFRSSPQGTIVQQRWRVPAEAEVLGGALAAAVRESAANLGIDL